MTKESTTIESLVECVGLLVVDAWICSRTSDEDRGKLRDLLWWLIGKGHNADEESFTKGDAYSSAEECIAALRSKYITTAHGIDSANPVTCIDLDAILSNLEVPNLVGGGQSLCKAMGRLMGRVEEATLDDLVGVADAAKEWGVSVSRARAHIALLHQQLGVGRQIGGSWVLLRRHVAANPPPPDGRGRRKTTCAERVVQRLVITDLECDSVGLQSCLEQTKQGCFDE